MEDPKPQSELIREIIELRLAGMSSLIEGPLETTGGREIPFTRECGDA